jgi:hypothetical protein
MPAKDWDHDSAPVAVDPAAAAPGDRRCPLCRGETTPGYLVSNESGHVAAFHGREKNAFGVSVRRSPVTARVCLGCGFVLLFATDPRPFHQESDAWQEARAPELMPAESPDGPDDGVAGT